MTSTKQYSQLIHIIPKLSVDHFLGLCATLCVSLNNENNEPREFPEVLSEVLDNLMKLPRDSRKDLLQVLKLAIK